MPYFKYSLLTQIVRGLVREDPQRADSFYLPRAFQELYSRYQPLAEPKIEDLETTFLGLLAESKDTYIVIDALDECLSPMDREEVLMFLSTLSQTALSSTHILIASRRDEDIETTISNLPNRKSVVPLEPSKVNDDIRIHLRECMTREPYRRWSDKLKTKVTNHLMELADGVFRWVDLQIMDLRGKVREKDVDKALKRLPKGLEQTYSRILA
jgi:hypothetical protein